MWTKSFGLDTFLLNIRRNDIYTHKHMKTVNDVNVRYVVLPMNVNKTENFIHKVQVLFLIVFLCVNNIYFAVVTVDKYLFYWFVSRFCVQREKKIPGNCVCFLFMSSLCQSSGLYFAFTLVLPTIRKIWANDLRVIFSVFHSWKIK